MRLDELMEPELIEARAHGLCSFGGSSPSGNTTVTQSNDPWSGQQPYLTDIFGQAQYLNQYHTPTYFPGDQVAPLTGQQQYGIGALYNTGLQGTPALNTAQGAVSNITGGATNLPAVGNYGLANQAIADNLNGRGIGGMLPAYTGMQNALASANSPGFLNGATGSYTTGLGAVQNLASGLTEPLAQGGFHTAENYLAGPLGAGGGLARGLVPTFDSAQRTARGLAGSSFGNEAAGSALGQIPRTTSGGIVNQLLPQLGNVGNAINYSAAGLPTAAQGFQAGEGTLGAQSGLGIVGGTMGAYGQGLNALGAAADPAHQASAGQGFNAAQNAIGSPLGAGGALAWNSLPTTMMGLGSLQQLENGANSNQTQGAFQAGQGQLQKTLGGDYLAKGNPYVGGLESSIAASVLPQIQSQFAAAGGATNPNAAYASAQGLGAALAPLEFQNYQQERGNQLAAAQQATGAHLGEQGVQQSAAQTALGNQAQQQGLMQGAAGLGLQGLAQQEAAGTSAASAAAQALAQQQGISSSAAQAEIAAMQGQQSSSIAGGQLAGNTLAQQQGLQQSGIGLGLSALGQQIGAQLGGAQLGAGMEQAQQGLTNQASALGLSGLSQQQQNQLAGAGLGIQNMQAQQGTQLAASGQTNQAMLAQQALQQQSEQLASQNYLTGQGQQLTGAGIAPSLNAATLGGMQTGLQAATIPQQQSQAEINAAMQKYNYYQMLPYQKLGLYQGNVTGNFGGTQNLTQPYFSNTAANLLSGGLGGIGLANGLFGAGSAGLGGTSPGLFSSGGALGGLFGGGGAAAGMSATDLASIAGISGADASAALGSGLSLPEIFSAFAIGA